jgi:hypothetical protein
VGYSSLQLANFTDTCFAVDAVPEMLCADALDEHFRVIDVSMRSCLLKVWRSGRVVECDGLEIG